MTPVEREVTNSRPVDEEVVSMTGSRFVGRRSLIRMVGTAGLGLAVALAALFAVPSRTVVAQEMVRPVPKAECGPNDRKETVQGRTTLAERFAPGQTKAFN